MSMGNPLSPVTISASPAPDANAAVQAILGPIIQQATGQAQAAFADTVNQAHAQSLQLIDDLTARVTANEQNIQDALAKAGGSVLANVETNPRTQQIVVAALVAGTVVGCLIVLVAYLSGNPQAGKIIAGVPAAGAALFALFSRFDGTIPTKPAIKGVN